MTSWGRTFQAEQTVEKLYGGCLLEYLRNSKGVTVLE